MTTITRKDMTANIIVEGFENDGTPILNFSTALPAELGFRDGARIRVKVEFFGKAQSTLSGKARSHLSGFITKRERRGVEILDDKSQQLIWLVDSTNWKSHGYIFPGLKTVTLI